MDVAINPRGVDLSTHNLTDDEDIDWEEFMKYYSFALIRAGYKNSKDNDFDRIYQGASDAGVPVGCYHYFRFVSSAQSKQQALSFCSWMEGVYPTMGMWGDFEDRPGAGNFTKGTCQNWIEKYFHNIDIELGHKYKLGTTNVPGNEPGAYTSYGFWDSYITPPAGNNTDIPRWTNPARPRNLWVAHWYVEKPRTPWDWATRWGDYYLIHQDTNKENGEPFGIPDSTIDGNWYNGTYADFNAQFGTNISAPGSTPEPPPPPQPTDKVIEIAYLGAGTTLNIRRQPWGDICAMTWDGERFRVVTTQGYEDNPQKYWIKIAGDLVGDSVLSDQWIASWYTKPIA